ncbi:MAG: hypothetical protein HRT89_03115 [Lentisphaeria bacterium]|nr:hypothetical protein [Lentisphaeria bacterium]NQZ67040.1 hypothetical protein [Lentisphaeria bacterium]
MKTILTLLISLAFVVQAEEEAPLDAFKKPYSRDKSYKKLTPEAAAASMPDYKRKKIQVEGIYTGLIQAFPPILTKRGKKIDKYYAYKLNVGGTKLIILHKRDKKFKVLYENLKKGAKIRVYGKVEHIKVKMEMYYVETDSVVLIKEKAKINRKKMLDFINRTGGE